MSQYIIIYKIVVGNPTDQFHNKEYLDPVT